MTRAQKRLEDLRELGKLGMVTAKDIYDTARILDIPDLDDSFTLVAMSGAGSVAPQTGPRVGDEFEVIGCFSVPSGPGITQGSILKFIGSCTAGREDYEIREPGIAKPVWIACLDTSDRMNFLIPYQSRPVGAKAPPGMSGLAAWIPGGIDISEPDPGPPPRAQLRCECGSEACGSPAHSSWCPKYGS